jgi:hypothetical protein
LTKDLLGELINKRLERHQLAALGYERCGWPHYEPPKREPRPFYGVDGNLLVEDLSEYHHDSVNEILDDTYKPSWSLGWLFPSALFEKYPQLRAEREKRRHHKKYRAELTARRDRGAARVTEYARDSTERKERFRPRKRVAAVEPEGRTDVGRPQ